MIKSTFQFLPRIRADKEKAIWSQGIRTWDDFLNAQKVKGISDRIKKHYDLELLKAKQALHEDRSEYFIDKLPSTETWRLYDYFREQAIFLDIETSSSTSQNSFLTVIGLYDGFDTKTMIKDVNLDLKVLEDTLRRYKLIISFNGSTFDLPYLKKRYRLSCNVPHIELRHLCARVGLRGGLKEIERKLGIRRENDIIEKIRGGDAIKLWRMFKGSKDPYYLELLIKYNEEDIINLKKITEHSIKKLKETTNPSGPPQG